MPYRRKTWIVRKYFNNVLRYVKIFAKSSTFHGVHHLSTAANRHWLEGLFWLLILFAFGGGAVWTIKQSYERYLANPTVITLDKNYRSWNITFPASTICFVDKFDAVKAENLVKNRWKPEDEQKFDYYMKFLNILSNSSYYNLASFEEFKDDRVLEKENLFLLMNEVNFEPDPLTPILFNKKVLYYFKTMLEMGICYSVSALMAGEFALDNKKEFTSELQHCEFVRHSCYGMMEGLPRETAVYIHSPNEIPIATSFYHTLYYNYHLELAYNEFQIKASSHIRELHPDQRRCYFLDEPIVKSIKYYSFNSCIMQCRKALAMKLCGCIPHFYKPEEGERTCTLKQLSCITVSSSELLGLSRKRNETEKFCTCYPSCEDSYVVFDYESISNHSMVVDNKIIYSTRYRWAIEKYSKTRYRRDILFGVEELIVSFGGTACFFLGGSIMSGIELIYFFTVRFIRYFKN